MALRRETFHAARVAAYWRGAVSDDFRLAEAVHDAGLTIAFAPGAMVATLDGTTATEFLSWIGRQMVITKTYRRGLWTLAFFAHIVYVSALVASIMHAPGALIPQLALAFIKGRNRAAIATRCLPGYADWFARWAWIYSWGTVAGTLTWVYSFLASAFTNSIHWRGRHYVLRYPGKPSPDV